MNQIFLIKKQREKVFSVAKASKKLFCYLIVTLALLCMQQIVQAQTVTATMRAQYQAFLTGSAFTGSTDTDIVHELGAIGGLARVYSTSMNSSSRTQLFAGLVDSASVAAGAANIQNAYIRLKTLAMGYGTLNSSSYHNAAVGDSIANGLKWMHTNRYNTTTTQIGSWFDWQIGIPLILNDIMILAYPALTQTDVDQYVADIGHFTPPVGNASTNGVNQAQILLMRGVLSNNTSLITSAMSNLEACMVYETKPTEGFYDDGSFQMHSAYPYNGGYGATFFDSMPYVIATTQGTAYALPSTDFIHTCRWAFDSFKPIIYKGACMAMFDGRYIGRNGVTEHALGRSIMNTLLRFLQTAPTSNSGFGTDPRGNAYPANPQSAMKAMLKYWYSIDTVYKNYVPTDIYTTGLYKAFLTDGTTPMAEPTGQFNFPIVDRSIHLSTGWGIGVSMFSTRLKNFESGPYVGGVLTGENKEGFHTADGMTYIYNNDETQYDQNYFIAVNNRRMAGTTHELDATETYGVFSTQAWAGSTALSTGDGMASMQLAVHNLTAKKSWFMFHDVIVALGAGITDPDNIGIATTVDNRKLKSDLSNVLSVNGTAVSSPVTAGTNLHNVTSIHLTGNTATGSDIGYGFYTPTSNITYSYQARTGVPADLFDGGSTTPITQNFFTFLLGHGTAITNQKYAYVILPNKTAAQTNTYMTGASSPDANVIRNDDSVQAVKQQSTNIIGAVFWREAADSIDVGSHHAFITAGSSISLMVYQTGTTLEIACSDPTQLKTSVVNVTVKIGVTTVVSIDPGITLHQAGATVPTIISFHPSGLNGKTQHIVLGTVGGGTLAATSFSAVVKTDSLAKTNAAATKADSVAATSTDKPFAPVLYPNPASGSFNIAYYSTADQPATVTIYDMNGVKKQTTAVQLSKGKNDVLVDVSHLTAAIYYVVLNNANETVKKQLIISK